MHLKCVPIARKTQVSYDRLKKNIVQVLQSLPFEVVKWPFLGSSDLELVVEKATLKNQGSTMIFSIKTSQDFYEFNVHDLIVLGAFRLDPIELPQPRIFEATATHQKPERSLP